MVGLNRSLLLAERTWDQPSGVNRASWPPFNDQEGLWLQALMALVRHRQTPRKGGSIIGFHCCDLFSQQNTTMRIAQDIAQA